MPEELPRVNWPSESGKFKIVQLYFGDEPYLRFPYQDSNTPPNFHFSIMLNVEIEHGLRKPDFNEESIQFSEKEQSPPRESFGYRASGMGLVDVDLGGKTLTFFGRRSDHYEVEIDTGHLENLKKYLPDWKIDFDPNRYW